MAEQFPHISRIQDEATQVALRVLWDRLEACERRILICRQRRRALSGGTDRLRRIVLDLKRTEFQVRG